MVIAASVRKRIRTCRSLHEYHRSRGRQRKPQASAMAARKWLPMGRGRMRNGGPTRAPTRTEMGTREWMQMG